MHILLFTFWLIPITTDAKYTFTYLHLHMYYSCVYVSKPSKLCFVLQKIKAQKDNNTFDPNNY